MFSGDYPQFDPIFIIFDKDEPMRQVLHTQLTLGEIDISAIPINLTSRDEVQQVLAGLKHIYTTRSIWTEVKKILLTLVPPEVSIDNGRMGLELWRILVIGTLRLNCKWDYDHLLEHINEHRTIRRMLGHGFLDNEQRYSLQTIKDNVRLFTPEILARINAVVVKAGHQLLLKDKTLRGSFDSFVVETNVHFPTDLNLLWDAMRKVIGLTAQACQTHQVAGWRQRHNNQLQVKRAFRHVQKMKASTSPTEAKKVAQADKIKAAHVSYLALSMLMLARVEATVKELESKSATLSTQTQQTLQKQLLVIAQYVVHAQRQIDQIRQRVLQGQPIDHKDKVFSLFEPHTEWISKGKAGVPQELGVRVGIIKDQFGFLLHARVMKKETDEKVVVPVVTAVKTEFPAFKQCSFDKGCHSPENQAQLAQLLEKVILPKKGKLPAAERERERAPEFVTARHQHSAVESSINALENHGLDCCPDHGLDGFERYVALAVLGRNIQLLGRIVMAKQQKQVKRLQKQVSTPTKS